MVWQPNYRTLRSRDSLIAATILTLSVLEAYIRARHDDVPVNFRGDISKGPNLSQALFPEFNTAEDASTVDSFRNGLSHNVTLRLKQCRGVWFVHDGNYTVKVDGKRVYCNPNCSVKRYYLMLEMIVNLEDCVVFVLGYHLFSMLLMNQPDQLNSPRVVCTKESARDSLEVEECVKWIVLIVLSHYPSHGERACIDS